MSLRRGIPRRIDKIHPVANDFLLVRIQRRGLTNWIRRRALTAALTTDHHFEQAGFIRLLLP